jgi:hypothetical protein
MENKAYIFDLHEDHVEWLKTLDFYQDDLEILKKRLAEVSINNTNSEVKHQVEKYQNKFIIQKNEIDLLKHYIKKEEAVLVEDVKANPVASDHRKSLDNEELRNRFNEFGVIFSELKNDFNEFVGKHL